MSDTSRFEQILRALPSGVIILDAKGVVVEANPVAVVILGEPLLGQRWLTVINRCFQPRSDDGLEVSLKDGRRLHIAISALNPGQLIVLTDLTETRALQQRINHLQRLSTLGKMMATLAHQIRTPLASAMLYAENLSTPLLAVQRREQFQQKLVLRLRELEQQVNDMLLFARSGTAQAVQPLSLQQLLSIFAERSEAMLLSSNAELQFCCVEEDIQLLANPQSLCEALLNLLQNSVQATGPGAQIRLGLQRENAQQFTLLLSDSGPGIEPELLPHIFEPCFTRKAGGSGLGLAVVQAVIQSHQGQIHYLLPAERPSAQLSGACFAITLPIMAQNAKGKVAIKPKQQQQETSHV